MNAKYTFAAEASCLGGNIPIVSAANDIVQADEREHHARWTECQGRIRWSGLFSHSLDETCIDDVRTSAEAIRPQLHDDVESPATFECPVAACCALWNCLTVASLATIWSIAK